MKVIIVGLGRLGSQLAVKLDKEGRDVTVIDKNPNAFKSLDVGFNGQTVEGYAYDKGTLEAANINRVDAIVACTNSDEVNVVVARVAKNKYYVPRVIARVYDTKKADVYHRLGIETLAPTAWGVDRAYEMLNYNRLDSVYDIGSGKVQLVRVEVPELLVGHTVKELTRIGSIHAIAITRNNMTQVATEGMRLESRDVIYLILDVDATDSLKSMLGL